MDKNVVHRIGSYKKSNPGPERASVKSLLSPAHDNFVLEGFLTTFFIGAKEPEWTLLKTLEVVFPCQNFLKIFGGEHFRIQLEAQIWTLVDTQPFYFGLEFRGLVIFHLSGHCLFLRNFQ